MPLFKLAGRGGELRAGGRVAATLGPWLYRATPGGWFVGAGLLAQNAYPLDHGAEFELRLTTDATIHIATDCHPTRTPGFTDRIGVVGETTMERVPRYASTQRSARPGAGSERPPERVEPVRARRGYAPA